MGGRRVWVAMLIVGLLAAAGSAVAPVSTEGFGTCGAAGTWFPYLGDPTGPGEPTFVYAEYNACGRAATPWHLTMLGGLLLALAGLLGVVAKRS